MPMPWRRRKPAGPALSVYRCRWSLGALFILLGFLPAGVCWYFGGWEDGLGRGYGVVLLIAGWISLFYVTSVMSTRFDVRSDGLTRIKNGRWRHFPWDDLRAVRRGEGTLPLAQSRHSGYGERRSAYIQLLSWEVTGIGGRIVLRVPNLIGNAKELLHEIEMHAGIHRTERIEEAREKAGKPAQRPAREVAPGAVGMGDIREGRDVVSARRKRRWTLRRGQGAVAAIWREAGIVLAVSLFASFIALFWAFVIGDPPKPRKPYFVSERDRRGSPDGFPHIPGAQVLRFTVLENAIRNARPRLRACFEAENPLRVTQVFRDTGFHADGTNVPSEVLYAVVHEHVRSADLDAGMKVGDSDRDGQLEFHDRWGNPLVYMPASKGAVLGPPWPPYISGRGRRVHPDRRFVGSEFWLGCIFYSMGPDGMPGSKDDVRWGRMIE